MSRAVRGEWNSGLRDNGKPSAVRSSGQDNFSHGKKINTDNHVVR